MLVSVAISVDETAKDSEKDKSIRVLNTFLEIVNVPIIPMVTLNLRS